jgi:hypothetical protein
MYTVPSPFQKQASISRLAREEEKSRSVKIYKANGTGRKKTLGPKPGKLPQPQPPQGHVGQANAAPHATQPKPVGKGASKKAPSKPKSQTKPIPKAKIANTALADQLESLKSVMVLAPAKPPKKKKRRSPKKSGNSSVSMPYRETTPSKRPSKARSGMPFVRVVDGRISEECPVTEKSESRFSSMPRPMGTQGGVNRNFYYEDPDAKEPTPQDFASVGAGHREEDAGRHMGHSFRDRDGRFGSLPMHDVHDERDDT